MRTFGSISRVLFSAALCGYAVGCTNAATRQIVVTMPESKAASRLQQHARVTIPSAPSKFDGFNCFALNVTGDGISRDARASSFCANGGAGLGQVGGTANFSGGSIALPVPEGPARTFQLVGVMTSDGSCPSFDAMGAYLAAGNNIRSFALGQTSADVFADEGISIQGQYDPKKPQEIFTDCNSNTAAPSKLVFSTQPSITAIAGVALTQQPTVTLLDSGGATLPIGDQITITAFNTVGCTGAPTAGFVNTTVTANAGIATFSGLIGTVATTVYLQATDTTHSTVPSACSGAITISPSTPTSLIFATQPGSGSAGMPLAIQPVIKVADAYGNPTGTGSPSVNLVAYTQSNCSSSAGGTLSPSSLTGSAGIATFSGVSYSGTAGTFYIQATATGYSSTCSGAFNVSAGSVTSVTYTITPPGTAQSSIAFGPAPIVKLQDTWGNLVDGATVTLGAYTTAGCVSSLAPGTLSQPSGISNAGYLTLGSLNYLGPTANIYLKATSNGTFACSSAIMITPGPNAKLAFFTQPATNPQVGVPMAPSPIVIIQDSYGNATGSGSDTISLAAYPGAGCTGGPMGSLSTSNMNATGGSASFSSLVYNGPSGTQSLQATAAGLASACSNTLTTAPGVAAQTVFVTQPSSGAQAGVLFPTQPIVQLQDAYGNLVNASVPAITLYAFPNSNCTGSLTGTLTAGASTTAGVASFANVKYSGAATTLYLQAYASGLGTLGCSTAVSVGPGLPAKLIYTTPPSLNFLIGSLLNSPPVVQVQDQWNTPVTSASNPVLLTAYSDPSCITTFATVTASTNPATPSSANAAFSNVNILLPSPGPFYLGATSSGLTTACAPMAGISHSIISTAETGTHTCAFARTGGNQGNVYCWGQGASGQLGNNTYAAAGLAQFVVGVGNTGHLSSIVGVSTGTAFSCAVNVLGNVFCWGDNSFKQIGNAGAGSGISTPLQVYPYAGEGTSYLQGMVQVAAGAAHACALTDGGAVYCWGDDSQGELGDGGSTTQQTPVPVKGLGGVGFLSNIVSIAAGYYETCAADTLGNAYCWGMNSHGQLGDNTTSGKNVPVQVQLNSGGNLTGVTKVAVGGSGNFACAIAGGSNNVFCWGNNANGQLGDNNAPTERHRAVQAGALTGVTWLSTGGNHTCIQGGGVNIFCWGVDSTNQLGYTAALTQQNYPQSAYVNGTTAISTAYQVSAGQGTSCFLNYAGNVYCWGDSSNYTIGNNSTSQQQYPQEVCSTTGCGSYLSGIY